MLGRPLSRRKGRRIGVEVRPEAVKSARLEAGLTLAQLGGSQLTRAAVHLIENGKAKPSLESIQLIARRTGKPLEHFLVDPAAAEPALRLQEQLTRLGDLAAQRRSEDTVALARDVLATTRDSDTAAVVRVYLGQALYRLLRPEEALAELRAARARFESAGDPALAVEAMTWEAAALSLTDDPGAPALLERALEIGAALKPPPVRTLAQIHALRATFHRTRQEWTAALRSYDLALEMAGSVRDLQLLARLYDDMAEAYQHLGQPGKAIELITQAIRLYSLEADPAAAYRAENNLGDILMQQGRLDAAESHFQAALEGSDRLGSDRRGRAYVLANIGELYWRRGELERAADHLARAREVAAALDERILVARVESLLAQIAEARGEEGDADQLFGAALARLAALDVPERRRRTHMAYAEILERRGDYRSAAAQWRAAAQLSGPAAGAAAQPADTQAG